MLSLHPSDETLSRLADQSEIERMHSRAGRHAAQCGRCRSELAAITALGDAARAMAEPALPPGLTARIGAARARVADAHGAPSLFERESHGPLAVAPEERRRWTTKKRAAAVAAAAAVVVAVLAWPVWRQRNLTAAAPGSVTIYPRYPRPGATIGIRFVPGPGWKSRDTLWAEAYIDLRDVGGAGYRATTRYLGALLLRASDGAYRGRAVLPAEALSGDIRVMTEPPGSMTGRRVTEIVLLTSDSSAARPSLDAMESAVFHDRSLTVSHALADAFARWAPDHPMRWLVSNSQNDRGFDWLKFFDSAERRFARLTTRLDAERAARPGELAGMAALAYRIEEPGAAAEWTDRLVREHPDNPWAFELRVRQLHEMELRGAPRDSIARLMPSLDTLYERSGPRLGYLYNLWNMVVNNGDSATIRRWALREARAGNYFGNAFTTSRAAFSDSELRDSVEAFARERLADTVTIEPRFAVFERARAYSFLASAALARGEYRRVLSLTDSARVSACVWLGQDSRALALLALGDTAAATPYLAAFGRNGIFLTADSARRMLGSHVTTERWQQAVDSVEAARRECRRRGQ